MNKLTALLHEVWKRTPLEAQAYIRALEARVATLEGMMQALQEQLNQTSRNSSRPPSSDPPHRERPPHLRSTRRRGGQPGHPGFTRTLIPVEEVDEVVVIKPTQCSHCQAPLAADLSTSGCFLYIVKWLYSSGHTETRAIVTLERCVR